MIVGLLLWLQAAQMGNGPTVNMPMPDPVRISGIPLPASDLPPGSIRVRVVRDEITAVVPGATVELLGQGDNRSAKADETGHVQFDKLHREVTYRVVATIDGKRVESRPFEGTRQGGLKFMLVGKAARPSGGGAPGPGGAQAIPDPAVPAGTIEVRLAGPGGQPLGGKVITLISADQAKKTSERTATTDAQGRARFTKVESRSDIGYLIVAKVGGAAYRSAPFRMPNQPGVRIALEGAPVSSDVQALQISQESHIAIELGDEQVSVFENLVIENSSDAAVDPGPSGLVFELPTGFAGAQAMEEAPPEFQIVEKQGVAWKGTIAPGKTPLRVAFVMPVKGGTLVFRQAMPISMDGVRVIVERTDRMNISGPSVQAREERELQGRKFWLVGSQGKLGAQSPIEMTIEGLPTADKTSAYAAIWVSLSLIAGTVMLSRRHSGRAQDTGRSGLVAKRDGLLGDLAALERSRNAEKVDDHRYRARRSELVSALEGIYRDLDRDDTF